MKFIHISDLHIGKRVHEFSMLEDQEFVLDQILTIAAKEQVDGAFIAGDIYDKSVPPAEAVGVFDEFLTRLAACCRSVFLISGNHDSPERLAFGARLMQNSGIYLASVFDGEISPVVLTDGRTEVAVYMLPFVKPAHVRQYFPEAEIDSYTDALRTVLRSVPIDTTRRNILIAHQFVTGAQRSESEELFLGGLDNVDAEILEDFDYVALGHIHRPQSVGRETIRYCGAPLAYAFSEADSAKSVTIVEIEDTVSVRTAEVTSRRRLRQIKGSYMELTARSYYETMNTEDYLKVILTDEEDVPNALGKLRTIYPNIMRLEYDNLRTRGHQKIGGAAEPEQKSPLELFGELYEKQNNQPMSQEQREYLQKLLEEELL